MTRYARNAGLTRAEKTSLCARLLSLVTMIWSGWTAPAILEAFYCRHD
jgi:hypothetical protein